MAWHGTSSTNKGFATLSENQRVMLAELAEDSEYWESAQKFVKSIDGRLLNSLSNKQMNWFYEIEATLTREIWREEGREAFREPFREEGSDE